MKKLLTIFCFLSLIESNAQTKFEFSKIDTLNVSKSELFVRANSWMANVFKSSKAVIQMEDKEAGKIIAKAAIPWQYSFMGSSCECYIHYTITIDTKVNKARITLSNFYHEGCKIYNKNGGDEIGDGGSLDNTNQPWIRGAFKNKKQKWWDDIRETATTEADKIIKSFSSEIRNSDDF